MLTYQRLMYVEVRKLDMSFNDKTNLKILPVAFKKSICNLFLEIKCYNLCPTFTKK